MLTSRENIMAIVNEYKIFVSYTHAELERLLDREKIVKLENTDKENDITTSLLFNSYGCYLRVWHGGVLEVNVIRIKEYNPKAFTSFQMV